mgnify:CR=1 FL=1
MNSKIDEAIKILEEAPAYIYSYANKATHLLKEAKEELELKLKDDKLVYPKKGYIIPVSGAVLSASYQKDLPSLSRGAVLSTKQQAEEMLPAQNKLFFLSHLKQEFDSDFVADFKDFKQQKYTVHYRHNTKIWDLIQYNYTEIPQIYFSRFGAKKAKEYLNKHYPDGWPC